MQYRRIYGNTAIEQAAPRHHLAHPRTRGRKTGFAGPYPSRVMPLTLRDGCGGFL